MSDEGRAFQERAQRVLAAQSPGRSRPVTDRLHCNGEDFAAAEDAANIRGLGGRWRRSAW
jgi:hypothetical protein